MSKRVSSIIPLAALAFAMAGAGLNSRKPTPPIAVLHPAEIHSDRGCSLLGIGGPGDGGIGFLPSPKFYGGKIIPNVKIVMVLYGQGTYAPFMTSTDAPNMESFYRQVVNSTYIDWLSEYSLPNQTIGRGTFHSNTTIVVSPNNDTAEVTDDQLQNELDYQINAGVLPVPDKNTLYMVHFPKEKTTKRRTSRSCVVGGFCGYHSTGYDRNRKELYYSVLPDMSVGTGCETKCGSSTWFNNQCSVASHELIESITDPEIGLATGLGPPVAWFDPDFGEIADICNLMQATFTGADGNKYTVQKGWSNVDKQCITERIAAHDYTSSVQITQGAITYDPISKRYVQPITVKNIGRTNILAPISFVLDQLGGRGVILLNKNGLTTLVAPLGSPYKTVPGWLLPNASSSTILYFKNLNNVNISYVPRVLAGYGKR